MLLNQYNNPPVYRLTPGTKQDSYGDEHEDWDNPNREPVRRALFQHAAAIEADGVTRHLFTDLGHLYISGRTTLTAKDRIEIGDKQWEVQGEPEFRPSSTGNALTVAQLKRFNSGGDA